VNKLKRDDVVVLTRLLDTLIQKYVKQFVNYTFDYIKEKVSWAIDNDSPDSIVMNNIEEENEFIGPAIRRLIDSLML
jgi:hypothetical protein